MGVRIHKTFANDTFMGTFVLPHKYRLEVAQYNNKTYRDYSMEADTPGDVKFWFELLRNQARQQNLSFEPVDATKEFAELVA